MLNLLKNTSIRNKIIIICLMVTALVLLISSTISIYREQSNSKALMLEHLYALAESTGISSSAALMFQKKSTAVESLFALQALPEILQARIYAADKSMFVEYVRDKINASRNISTNPSDHYPLPDHASHHFSDTTLVVSQPIIVDQELIGFVVLKSSLDKLRQAFYLSVMTSLLTFLVSMGLAFIVATLLQRMVSEPIISLKNAMTNLSKSNDYSLRVATSTSDEVGKLVGGFNHMVGQLQIRDEELNKHKLHLEDEVRARTQEIYQINDELKQAANKMRIAKEAAEAANKAKSEFLATMSHEIRTPLNGVLGIADLMGDTQLTEQQKRYLKIANMSGQLLLNIINDILDISKIESGKFELHLNSFDLIEVVEDVVTLFSKQAHTKSLSFYYYFPWPTEQTFIGDEARIKQILVNLISNSLKFTEQGFVRLSVEIDNQSTSKEPLVIFSIQDTGVGITAEAQAKIFAAFTQADSSTTRKFGGTGLGLAICKNLIGLMQGDIQLSSQIEQGTEFTVKIPLQADKKINRRVNLDKISLENLVFYIDITDQDMQKMIEQYTAWIGAKMQLVESIDDLLTNWAQLSSNQICAIFEYDSMEKTSLFKRGKLMETLAKNNHLVFLMTDNPALLTGQVNSCYPNIHLIEKPLLPSQLSNYLTNHYRIESSFETQEERSNKLRGHVLLVEDTILNQEIACEMLTCLGMTYAVCNNGLQAQSAFKAGIFDLVLMDCQMPIMDGYEATRRLRNLQSETPALACPIIALTANAVSDDREKCIQAGMDDYLSKPINQKRLFDMLSKWLPENKKIVEVSDTVTHQKSSIPKQAVRLNGFDTLAESQLIDQGVVDELFNMTNDDNNLLPKLVCIYLTEAPIYIQNIQTSVQKFDFINAKKEAHALKSYSMNLGLIELGNLCKSIEANVKDERMDTLESLQLELLQAFEKIQPTLAKYIDKSGYRHA